MTESKSSAATSFLPGWLSLLVFCVFVDGCVQGDGSCSAGFNAIGAAAGDVRDGFEGAGE